MKKLNFILSLLSLNALLVTIERFSFTTKIVLQPYSYLRVHEVFQMTVLILLSTVLPFFLLKVISNNFESLKTKKGMIWATVFIIGLYFYSTGNGVHELSSYLFNQFCNTKHFTTTLCGNFFFNDYYFGNILYFVGLFLTNLALVILELDRPAKNFTRNDFIVTTVNGILLALLFFAYAAFDRVLVGLWFTIIGAVVTDGILIMSKKKLSHVPFIFYCALSYTTAAILSLLVRFH